MIPLVPGTVPHTVVGTDDRRCNKNLSNWLPRTVTFTRSSPVGMILGDEARTRWRPHLTRSLSEELLYGPVIGTFDESGTTWVSFDISAYIQKLEIARE